MSHAMGGPVQLYHRAPEAYEFEAKNSLVCLEEPTGGGFACDDWPDDDPAADLFGMHWHRWHTDIEVLLFGVRIMTDTLPLFPLRYIFGGNTRSFS